MGVEKKGMGSGGGRERRLRQSGVQKTESERGEENRGRIRRRMGEEEAKLQGLAASFHQTDSKL